MSLIKGNSCTLPKLINGGGYSSNPTINQKYMSLNSRLFMSPNKFDYEILKRKQPLNRNGTIPKNQFRGIRKDVIEKQATIICHSMTVGN